MYVVMRKQATLTTVAPVGVRVGSCSIYERTVVAVYSYLASRTGDRGVAEELTQDVLSRARVVWRLVTWSMWRG